MHIASDSPPSALTLEIAQVLFMDIVGYSRRSIEEQQDALRELFRLALSTPEVKAAQEAGRLLAPERGDGLALVFFSGDPQEPVRSAVGISKSLRRLPHLQVRMGLNSGPVTRETQGQHTFLSGEGIIMAQRVMDVGDPGHILVAGTLGDMLRQTRDWRGWLTPLGETLVKHDQPLRVYNFTSTADEIGNPAVPQKFVASPLAATPPSGPTDSEAAPVFLASNPAADLPLDPAASASANSRPHNLPAQATALIGRSKEIETVCAELGRDDVRLLTLTGPGGSGKTRLGIGIAERLLEEFEDGVFFVALAPIVDETLVLPTIAEALGLNQIGATPQQAALTHLRDRQVLLLLDNFEQVAGAAPEVGKLLAACPRVKALITSRMPLHLAGEHEFPVLPLALPNRKPPPAPEQLSQYAAVQLFIERALAVKPDFHVTNDNAPAVAEICFQLDGLPLAIELAAARVKLLPPNALLARLQSRLSLLTGGARDAPARQQTLRNTIAWSYDLLDGGDQTLFRRLSVFVDGFTLEAASAVCNEGNDALEGVCSLADKSLLRQSEDEQGEPRFWTLETIREYALESLNESGEAELMRRSHAHFFADEVARRDLEDSTARAAIQWATDEIDNLRAALDWTLDNEPETALKIATDLEGVWYQLRGDEGRNWLKTALERAPEAEKRLRARSFHNLALLTTGYDAEEHYYETSLQLFRELDDKQGMGRVLSNLSVPAGRKSDFAREQAMLREGLELARDINDDRGLQTALHCLGSAAMREGDFAAAKLLFKEALTINRRLGSDWGLAYAEMDLSLMHYLLGELPPARQLAESSYAILLANGYDAPRSRWLLGRITAAEGDWETGWQMLARGLKDLDEDTSEKGKGSWLHAQFLEALGCLCIYNDEIERAARIWGAAEMIREEQKLRLFPMDRTDYDPTLEKARAALDAKTFNAAWQAGRNAPRIVIDELTRDVGS